MNNDERRLLYKNMYLSLYCKVWKGYSRFYCERELETEQKLQYFDPTLMAISVVFFSFAWCSTGGPGAHSAGFLYCILSATSLDPNSSGPQGPPPPGFSITSCLLTRLISNCLTSVLTALYYSSRPFNRPLDLWNRMFDRHQAEITVMQFTGHSPPVHQSMSEP